MKSKLLLKFTLLLLPGMLHAQVQQMWAVTAGGGTSFEGTIISMNPDGTGLSVVYSYSCSATSGCLPIGNLLQASNGQLYGACYHGGQYGSCTIDRYDPVTGTYYDIYDFGINGDLPRSGLIEGPSGKLYGVVSAGGNSNCGVLYSVNLSDHTYVSEYDFIAGTGKYPWGCPVLKNGKLYGLTSAGGGCAGNGQGVIYSYEISSDTYTPLHQFVGADGASPKGSLYEASNGLFYGMTYAGGSDDWGTLFSFDPSNNTFISLHSFQGPDGIRPEGALVEASNGKLYGLAKYGGTLNAGVLFSFDPMLNLFEKLYEFTITSGAEPMGNLFQSTDGLLYGTASAGGSMNMGVIFSYDIALNTYNVVLNFNGVNGASPGGGFIMVNLPVGISHSQNEIPAIYPNPASDQINISLKKKIRCIITLINVEGEIIFSAENYSAQSAISTAHLPKGIYFIEVMEDNGKITTQKVVKM